MEKDVDSLELVGVYRRAVRASLERVWENVFDWEHLPYLHRDSFSAIERVDSGPWGWRARIALQPRRAGEFLLELMVDRGARRYVSRTLEGTGKGGEIWTQLDVVGPQCTAVEVEFYVPSVPPGSAAALGNAFTQLYRRLWDEDEAMMMRRAEHLAHPEPALHRDDPPLRLGTLAEVRGRLPFTVRFGGRVYRLVEDGGELLAHGVECPHMRGPLEQAAVLDGCVVCPWHGYRFDLRSGASADGRRLRLPPAPRVRMEPDGEAVWLVWPRRAGPGTS